jgi:hypothetical protein
MGIWRTDVFTPREAIILPRRVAALLVLDEADVAADEAKREADLAWWLIEFHDQVTASADEDDLLLDEALARRDSGRDVVVFGDEGGYAVIYALDIAPSASWAAIPS